MKDKLAEEILNKMVDGFVPYFSESEVIEAMQAYHQAKMKEVTDEDIERQIKQINRREALCTVDYYSTGFILKILH